MNTKNWKFLKNENYDDLAFLNFTHIIGLLAIGY